MNPTHNFIPSVVSVSTESSGLGQYLSVLKGTGASAGRGRDETDRTAQTLPGAFNATIRDHHPTAARRRRYTANLHHRPIESPLPKQG